MDSWSLLLGRSKASQKGSGRDSETKQFIRHIKGIACRKFTAGEKIRIVLERFLRDTPIRELCRRKGIRPSTYYAWLNDFNEAGEGPSST